MDYSDTEMITWYSQLTKGLHRGLYPFLDPKQNPDLAAKGKSVIITGVSGGVGQAIAEAWCLAGAAGVLITGRRTSALDEVAAKIRPLSSTTKVVIQPAELTSEDSVKQLYERAAAELGTIDVLINNAGTMNFELTGDIEPLQWWRDFEMNVKGTYFMDHYFIKQGGGKGTIITVGSSATGMTVPRFNSYSMSKTVQTRLTEYLHVEHPDLHVFTLWPGLLNTPMTVKDYLPYALDDPALTGGLSLFLCTPRAAWLRGQVVSVNWDIEEMEAHKQEILDKQLLKAGFMNAQFGKGGHPWET